MPEPPPVTQTIFPSNRRMRASDALPSAYPNHIAAECATLFATTEFGER